MENEELVRRYSEVNTYSNGDVHHVVQHLQLRDGRVWRATTYFAPPFEAPA
jgi:hypothetical protein